MRVQGGSTGLIAAIEAGTIDELDANFDCRLTKPRNRSNADWRRMRWSKSYLDQMFADRGAA